jgi:2-polyprenyl-6-methoxyphenol hydroxylase-like FAD-dependent oxidoreductase
MRNITIVGAGQSGLQLGLGLLQNGYRVRIVTNRTGADIAAGKVMSSQFMFNDALQAERDLGLNFWEKDCPNTDAIG